MLLRSVIGTVALWQGIASFSEKLEWMFLSVGVLAGVVAGLLFVLGLWTRIAGVVLCGTIPLLQHVSATKLGFNAPDSPLTLLLMETMAGGVVLLGPGAYSVDAHVFGRREIVIPRPR